MTRSLLQIKMTRQMWEDTRISRLPINTSMLLHPDQVEKIIKHHLRQHLRQSELTRFDCETVLFSEIRNQISSRMPKLLILPSCFGKFFIVTPFLNSLISDQFLKVPMFPNHSRLQKSTPLKELKHQNRIQLWSRDLEIWAEHSVLDWMIVFQLWRIRLH